MDRAALWAALVIAGVLLAYGALSLLREYADPVFINGGQTASRIDAQMGDTIAARFPAVAIGPASCPPVLNLTGRRTGHCVLPVAGSELRIDVGKSGPYARPELESANALFVARDAEVALRAQLLARYGEPFDVRCPGPDVRVIVSGGVTCSVEAPDVLRRGIEVTVSGISGAVFAEKLPGIDTREARTFGADVASRTEGGVTVTGAAMERYIRESAAAEANGEVARRGLLGAVHCPPHIVLREGSRRKCTLWAGGLPLRYDVRFEKGLGMYLEVDQQIQPLAQLREIATRYFERPRYTEGKPLQARVDCGVEKVVFVEPGSTVPCTVKVGKESIDFAFQFFDRQGGFTIEEN